jgi:hypothetical protein
MWRIESLSGASRDWISSVQFLGSPTDRSLGDDIMYKARLRVCSVCNTNLLCKCSVSRLIRFSTTTTLPNDFLTL